MLALKLVMPEAVPAIAYDKFGEHAFDRAVCDFFGVDFSKESFETLRRTAATLCGGSYFHVPPNWNELAEQLHRINHENSISLSDA